MHARVGHFVAFTMPLRRLDIELTPPNLSIQVKKQPSYLTLGVDFCVYDPFLSHQKGNHAPTSGSTYDLKLRGKKVNVGIIVQLSKDLMDWVSQRLCFTFGDTDRSVSWTSVYSLIRKTWGRMEFVHLLTSG